MKDEEIRKQKITYEDLSPWLKALVWFGSIELIWTILIFTLAFILIILGVE